MDPEAASLAAVPPGLAGVVPPEVWHHFADTYAGVVDQPQLVAHVKAALDPVLASSRADLVQVLDERARRVLDVGCGIGSFVLELRGRGALAVGVEITAVEASFAAIRGAEALPADASALPFADGSFDVVTMWNVLEHTGEPEGAMREAHRVLRPDGLLVVESPNYAAFRREAHYHLWWAPWLHGPRARRRLERAGRDPGFWATSIRPVTKRDIERALDRTGFTGRRGLDPLRLGGHRLPASRWKRAVVLGIRRTHLDRVARAALELQERNPLKPSIRLVARRAPGGGRGPAGVGPTAGSDDRPR